MQTIVAIIILVAASINIAKAEVVSIEKDCHKVVMVNPNVVNKNKLYDKDYVLVIGDLNKETNYLSLTCFKSVYKQSKEEVKSIYKDLTSKE